MRLLTIAVALPLMVAGFATPSVAAPSAAVAETPPGVNDFRSIIKLSNCSASLVRFPNSQGTDKALMLTNGHCMRGRGAMPKPGEVAVNEPSRMAATILDAKGVPLGNVSATKILFGTMTDSDQAIIELDPTFDDIQKKYNTTALTLSDRGPKVGDKITVASGYWKLHYHCSMEFQVHQLLEQDWVWKDSIRYSPECRVKGGTSGSPLLDDVTGLVVGVNNTVSETGAKCTMNNPCEKDEQGNITYKKDRSYAQQTALLHTCWTEQRTFDFAKPGCALPKKTA